MTDNRCSGRPAGPEPGPAVAVLGTGIMGSAMARNLVAAGLRTTVWDRLSSATGPLADAGAMVAAWTWPSRPRTAPGCRCLRHCPAQWRAAVAAGYGRDDISAAGLALGDHVPARRGPS